MEEGGKRMAGKRKRQGAIGASQTTDQRAQDSSEERRRERRKRRRRRAREEGKETIRLLRERVRDKEKRTSFKEEEE